MFLFDSDDKLLSADDIQYGDWHCADANTSRLELFVYTLKEHWSVVSGTIRVFVTHIHLWQ